MFKSTLLYLCFCLLPLLSLAQDATNTAASPVSTSAPLYNGGDDNPPDPNDAGAEGSSKGAFSLSKGGIAAIIVVAVIVAVGGSQFAHFPLQAPTNSPQSPQRSSSGLPKRDNGMSAHLSAGPLAASRGVPKLLPNAKTDAPASDLTRLLQAGKIATLRRPFRLLAQMER